MDIVLRGISLLVIVLLHQSVVVELLIVRRHYHDGILYEDFAADSDNVRYTITNGKGWEDLDSLVETWKLRDKSMFCTRGPGAWLLYQNANYQFGNMRMLKLVYGEHCVAADNVNSLQPLGAVYLNIDDVSAVVAFSEKYFQSKGETTRLSISQNVKSAIFVGTGNWTVEAEGKKTCVVVQNMGDVCLLEDIQNSFSITSEDVKIEKGCDNDTDATDIYHLQTCYSTGFHELTYDFDLTLPSLTQICSGAYDENDQAKDKFVNVVKIWKKRMNPPTSEHFPPNVPNAAQRLNTLFQMVDIMSKTCDAVNDDFLETVKYIYMLHIKNGEIWNMTETINGTRIEQSHAKWSRAQSFIMNCANVKSDVSAGCQPDDISEMKNEKEIAVIEDFLNGESYDYVIEHIWLMLNYVSTYCNFHLGFKNNDWSIFPLMFKRDFLYPLQDQWKNPGKWSTYYTAMLNGYDMEKERKSMITCVQQIIKMTPFYDPLARPPGFYTGNSTAERDIIGGVTKAPKTNKTDQTTAKARKRRQHLYSNENEIPDAVEPISSSIKPTVITTTATPSTTLSPTTSATSAAGTKASGHHHHAGPKKSKKKKNKKAAASSIITIGTTTSKPIATSTAEHDSITPAETLPDTASPTGDNTLPITEIIIGAATPTPVLSTSEADKPSAAVGKSHSGNGKKGKKKKRSGKHHKKGDKRAKDNNVGNVDLNIGNINLKDKVDTTQHREESPPPVEKKEETKQE